MTGYHHHNLMDMYPGPAINTMDWKNTSQVGTKLVVITNIHRHNMENIHFQLNSCDIIVMTVLCTITAADVVMAV